MKTRIAVAFAALVLAAGCAGREYETRVEVLERKFQEAEARVQTLDRQVQEAGGVEQYVASMQNGLQSLERRLLSTTNSMGDLQRREAALVEQLSAATRDADAARAELKESKATADALVAEIRAISGLDQLAANIEKILASKQSMERMIVEVGGAHDVAMTRPIDTLLRGSLSFSELELGPASWV